MSGDREQQQDAATLASVSLLVNVSLVGFKTLGDTDGETLEDGRNGPAWSESLRCPEVDEDRFSAVELQINKHP